MRKLASAFVYKYYFINSNHFAYNINFLDRLRKRNIFEAPTTRKKNAHHPFKQKKKKVTLIYRKKYKVWETEQNTLKI